MFGTILPSIRNLSVSGAAQAFDPDEAAEPDVGALQGLPAAPLLRRRQEEGGAQRARLQARGGQSCMRGGPTLLNLNSECFTTTGPEIITCYGLREIG